VAIIPWNRDLDRLSASAQLHFYVDDLVGEPRPPRLEGDRETDFCRVSLVAR
jgi:hypothetical protein